MKKIFFTIALTALIIISYGQETTTTEGPWKFKGMASLNFSQVSLVNWAQGGDNSVALNGLSVLNLDYTKR